MAQLRDTVVQGNLRVTDDIQADTFAGKVQLMRKTFPEYTCTGTGENTANLYFGIITIDNTTVWAAPWMIHYRVHVSTTNANAQGWYDCTFSVSGNTVNYYIYNNFYSTNYRPIYHHRLMYPKNGYSSYGAKLGIRQQTGYSVNTLARTYTIEILELEGCSFSFYDTIQRQEQVYVAQNGTSASTIWYITDYNGTAVGLQETGDANDNTIAYSTRYSQNLFTSQAAITTPGKIVLQGDNNTMIPVSAKTSTATETTPSITSASFLIFGDYIYYGATAAANAALANANAWTRCGLNLQNSFNIGASTTARQDLYLIAIPEADGVHAKIANRTGTGIGSSSSITNQLPSTEDNKIYIKLCTTYNTTGGVILTENHPVYWFKNGKLRPYTAPYGTISTVSGNTLSLVDIDSTQVATYVPSVTIPGSTPVLEWNTGVTIATVNNVDIKAALPSNPWKVYYSSATPTGTIAEGSLWLKPM